MLPPTLSLPMCPKSLLYVCISIPALQIGLSVPFFDMGLCDKLEAWDGAVSTGRLHVYIWLIHSGRNQPNIVKDLASN